MNVLAMFAHPDDEVLGCGGTLARHAEAGDAVRVLFLVERGLAGDAAEAAAVLGIGINFTFELPDQKLDTRSMKELVKIVDGAANSWPDVVYTHHPGDLNLDHALTARAVLTAFRPKPGEKPRTILACEVLSSTEWTFPQVFQPNYFVTLTERQVQKKIDALACYPSEVEEWPHPRSPRGIRTSARWRGQQCGVTQAEAFQVLMAMWGENE